MYDFGQASASPEIPKSSEIDLGATPNTSLHYEFLQASQFRLKTHNLGFPLDQIHMLLSKVPEKDCGRSF